MNGKEKEENQQLLSKIEFLKGFTTNQVSMLAANVNNLKYQKNEMIVNKGD